AAEMITTFPQARLWEFVARSSPTGLLVLGPDGRILVANRAVELQFGYDGAELVGRPIEMLLPEGQWAAHAEDGALLEQSPTADAMAAGRYLSGVRKDG